MNKEEQLGGLCYEADRLCIILRQLEADGDFEALSKERSDACAVFQAIYEMTLRQDPPRKSSDLQTKKVNE